MTLATKRITLPIALQDEISNRILGASFYKSTKQGEEVLNLGLKRFSVNLTLNQIYCNEIDFINPNTKKFDKKAALKAFEEEMTEAFDKLEEINKRIDREDRLPIGIIVTLCVLICIFVKVASVWITVSIALILSYLIIRIPLVDKFMKYFRE